MLRAKNSGDELAIRRYETFLGGQKIAGHMFFGKRRIANTIFQKFWNIGHPEGKISFQSS
jgi:hypothetical protein